MEPTTIEWPDSISPNDDDLATQFISWSSLPVTIDISVNDPGYESVYMAIRTDGQQQPLPAGPGVEAGAGAGRSVQSVHAGFTAQQGLSIYHRLERVLIEIGAIDVVEDVEEEPHLTELDKIDQTLVDIP